MPLKKCPHCKAALPRKTRALNKYNLFVKDAMKRDDVKQLHYKERMAKCAELWKQKSTIKS